MTKVLVKLPIGLVGAEGPERMECEGTTLGEVLEDCARRAPHLRPKIFRDDGGLWVAIAVNGRSLPQQGVLETPLAEDDEIALLPPIAGG